MWKSLALAYLVMYGLNVHGQSTLGLTGKRDTSYSTYSAFVNTKKSHPDIRIVPELESASVLENKDIVYCEMGDRKLYLDTFYPKKKSKQGRAAILIIHGGGWR